MRISFKFPTIILLAALGGTACGKPQMGCDSDDARQALVTGVNQALNTQDCASAISLIEPFYNVEGCGTDEIRYARAAAYACAAGISFFQFTTDLAALNLTGAAMWDSFTAMFPSSVNDPMVTAGDYALDSLFAIRNPGALTPPMYLLGANSLHPRSLRALDRTGDSNLYTMMVSMSLIGSLQNRYGAPDASYHKTHCLGRTAGNANGWMDARFVDYDACTYAGAVLSMIDGIRYSGGSLSGPLAGTMSTVASTFQAGLDLACEAGCNGSLPVTGCNLPAGSCTPCPYELRNRNSCQGKQNDKASCAAAGLIYFINTNPLGWTGPL